jgi:hypothetical protein
MAPSVVTTGTSNSRKQTRVAACAAAVAALTAGFLVSTAGSAQAIATAVPLHTAESFAVLAGSGITNTGTTTIDGDVGASPTGTVTLNGPIILVPPSVYHQADAVADQAKTDLVTGYNNAAGQARDADSGGELGGQTLVAGVYGTDSTLGLTGTVTLDGGGRTDGVWVFQVGSGLTTASSSSVSLTNGAQACNVYWQVGSSATLGTSTAFVGTILANTSITATTGATIEGRLLASGGAVTLDSNTITKPGCLTTTQDAEVSASDASSEASASSAAAVQSAADAAQSAADQATSAAAEAAAAQAAAEAAQSGTAADAASAQAAADAAAASAQAAADLLVTTPAVQVLVVPIGAPDTGDGSTIARTGGDPLAALLARSAKE